VNTRAARSLHSDQISVFVCVQLFQSGSLCIQMFTERSGLTAHEHAGIKMLTIAGDWSFDCPDSIHASIIYRGLEDDLFLIMYSWIKLCLQPKVWTLVSLLLAYKARNLFD
jgi:hypothetical protein